MHDEIKYVEGFVQLLPLVPLHKVVIFPHMPATFELAGKENTETFEGTMEEGKEIFLELIR